jgi:hypothetical protein
MKRLGAALLMCAAVSTAAQAQDPRHLAFFADEAGTQCEVVNTRSEIVTINMFLYGWGRGASAVTFYAPTPACWTDALWLGDAINENYLWLGSTHDSHAGLTVAFGGCKDLPLYLGSMSFAASGSQPCCHYDVLPGLPATVNQLRIVDCDYNPVVIPYTSVTINPNAACPCGMGPVATEETSWSRLKALYR